MLSKDDDDYAKAKRKAFWLLSRQSYHSKVLLEKLKQKGFSQKTANDVVEECRRLGFIDDEAVLFSLLKRGYGPRYIQYKLQISETGVRRVITKEKQKEALQNMRSKYEDSKKAIQRFLRRGFDYEVVIEIFSPY